MCFSKLLTQNYERIPLCFTHVIFYLIQINLQLLSSLSNRNRQLCVFSFVHLCKIDSFLCLQTASETNWNLPGFLVASKL